MNMATNANVVEQFNRRKQEIEQLTAKVEDREKRVQRIEQSIKMARVSIPAPPSGRLRKTD